MTQSPPPPDKFSNEQTTYRLFYLGHDGAVVRAEILEAASDDEAKAIAAAFVNGHGIDLWERTRFLASFPPLAVSSTED